MHKLGARNVLKQLIAAYREESALYADLENTAAEQNAILRNGRDQQRLDALMDQQRGLAERIERIEAGIAPLREHWDQLRDSEASEEMTQLSGTLDNVLAGVTECIHRIVTIEKDTAQVLLNDMVPQEA
jgi:predicted nuclease with TOPRIM domain